MAFVQIYHLRDDSERVEVWRWSLDDAHHLGPARRIYGTDEWWQRIESGQIPTRTLDGTVKEVRREDAMFDVESGQRTTTWSIVGGDDWESHYVPGRRVRITYVDMHHEGDMIISVDVADSDEPERPALRVV